MPLSEYFAWCNEPTTREILDAHFAQLLSFTYSANKSKTAKPLPPIEFMILATDEDKQKHSKKILSNELKEAFGKFKQNIKK